MYGTPNNYSNKSHGISHNKVLQACAKCAVQTHYFEAQQSLEIEDKNIALGYRTSKVTVVTKHHAFEGVVGKVTDLTW